MIAKKSKLNIQHGGDHYKKFGDYQPWKVLTNWLTAEELKGYAKGTAIAYLVREMDKGGRLDIEKAIHTLQLYLELSETPSSEQFSEKSASKIPEILNVISETLKPSCHIRVGDWVEVDDDPEPWITPYVGFKAEVYATQWDSPNNEETVTLLHPEIPNGALTFPVEAVKLISKPVGDIR